MVVRNKGGLPPPWQAATITVVQQQTWSKDPIGPAYVVVEQARQQLFDPTTTERQLSVSHFKQTLKDVPHSSTFLARQPTHPMLLSMLKAKEAVSNYATCALMATMATLVEGLVRLGVDRAMATWLGKVLTGPHPTTTPMLPTSTPPATTTPAYPGCPTPLDHFPTTIPTHHH